MLVPNFDPVIFNIGPLAIRWYSLAYILGVIFTLILLKRFNNNEKIMSQKAIDDWLIWAIIGIVAGGRLGYVLFYNLDFYLKNPLQIMAVWNGGMSFHGGLIGSIISMFFFCKKYKINFLKLTDILAICAPIGIFFGRIANFINLELYGRVTNSKFGMIFPGAGDLPRHPSQLYEALLEGILSFIILFYLAKSTKLLKNYGFLSGLFLCLYSSARIFVEQFREPDSHIGLIFNYISMGQILSLPILIIGIITIYISLKRPLS